MSLSPLVLFAGESNNGHQNTGPAPYAPTARVQIWTDSDGDGVKDAFHYMQPGVNTGLPNQPGAWGAEVEFANRWLADNPEGILWIGKEAKGSTTLAFDWNDQGGMFAKAEVTANRMLANLGRDHLDAVFFTQGINDAFTRPEAFAYRDGLTELTADIRADWMHDEDGYIGIARVPVASAVTYAEVVNWSQRMVDVVDDHLESFDLTGFQFLADGYHLSAQGYVQVGSAYYDGWIG